MAETPTLDTVQVVAAPSKNLVQKIAEAVAEVGDMQKQGDNGEYTYIRARDVFHEIRRRLFSRGVLILPTKITTEHSLPFENVNGDMTEQECVTVDYCITDGTETLSAQCCGIGQDYHGKAIFKAITGSTKYLLLTLGLIAGVEDDPETVNDGPVSWELSEKLDAAEKKFGPDLREHPIGRRDVNAWMASCRKTPRTPKEQKKYLHDTFGISKISELKRKDFAAALDWALGNEKVISDVEENKAEPLDD